MRLAQDIKHSSVPNVVCERPWGLGVARWL
jgi:hypothetical protein